MTPDPTQAAPAFDAALVRRMISGDFPFAWDRTLRGQLAAALVMAEELERLKATLANVVTIHTSSGEQVWRDGKLVSDTTHIMQTGLTGEGVPIHPHPNDLPGPDRDPNQQESFSSQEARLKALQEQQAQ
jgi:hypothetical protein